MAGAIISQVSCHWGTPDKLLEGARYTFGGPIDLDPCGNANSTERVNAASQIWLPDEASGYVSYNVEVPCPGAPTCPEVDILGVSLHHHYQRACRLLPRNVVVDDGLTFDWGKYTNVFCNPPYGKDVARGTSIYNWIEKCMRTAVDSKIPVITLIPAAVGTKHWQSIVFPTADAICFLRGRVKFLLPGKDNVSTTPSAMVYWDGGAKDGRHERFVEYFSKLGRVI